MSPLTMPIDRTKHKRMILTVPHELVAEVRDYRFVERITTESEAWRELVRKGLEVWRREQQQRKDKP
jgi:hypothetical protein